MYFNPVKTSSSFALFHYFLPGQGLKFFCFWVSGCYFQEGKELKMEMRVEDAYKRSIETVLNWVHSAVNSSKTQVYFRTFAPVHFRFV